MRFIEATYEEQRSLMLEYPDFRVVKFSRTVCKKSKDFSVFPNKWDRIIYIAEVSNVSHNQRIEMNSSEFKCFRTFHRKNSSIVIRLLSFNVRGQHEEITRYSSII